MAIGFEMTRRPHELEDDARGFLRPEAIADPTPDLFEKSVEGIGVGVDRR